MPLTKVRPPVTAISIIDSGTTKAEILNAGGDIDIDVGGVNVMDLTSTTATVAVTLAADAITGEQILLSTQSGAGLTFETQATLARLLTTTAHPLELGANNITGLTIATDGKVELDVEGTSATHLVTKSYVDTQTAAVVTETDFNHTQAATGHLDIPTSTGTNLVLNWGVNGVVPNNADTVVTFDKAFPNAFFGGLVTPTTRANHDGTMEVFANTLSTMTVHSSLDKSSGFFWFAIGY